MEINLIGMHLLIISVLNLFIRTVSSKEMICQNNCTCDWTNGEVNCRSLGLDQIPDFGDKTSFVNLLNFGNNSLTKIEQKTFENLTNLTVLFIDFNKISDIDVSAFSKLTRLKQLKLNSNYLTKVKTNIFSNLNLESLLLAHNHINIIEQNALTNLPRLTMLSLAYNNISSLSASSFGTLPLLRTLYLRHNRLTKVPKNLCFKTPNLSFLLLNENKISSIDENAFSDCSNLTNLQLARNMINKIHEKGFYTKGQDSVTRQLKLETLNLETNQLDVLPSEKTFPASLQHFNLNDNLFRVVKPYSFRHLSSIRNLHISNNSMLSTIETKAFAGLSSLAHIFITQNSKLTSIAEDAFVDSNNVVTAFLENNALQDFSENLLRWGKVKVLNIRSNNFTCSCGLIWIQSSIILKDDFTKETMKDVKCTLGKNTQLILSLDPKTLHCDDTKSRLITGLVAATVASCSLVVCLILISCRRKLYTKYIQFKYRRQRDDPLFTVEDPRGKRKMFSSKPIYRKQNSREETLI